MPRFEDHFSAAARGYARYRPNYPAELFAYLSTLTGSHDLAWDAGTGSGQAAAGLIAHYRRVVATDPSAEQISLAPRVPGVEYRNEAAEHTSLESGSVDLVAAAAAVHWFDLDRFYTEVDRVLRPTGVIAVWAYYYPVVAPEIDHAVARYGREVIDPYWPERSRHVLEEYRSLPFPYARLEPPEFAVRAQWDLERFVGFLTSWSAAIAYARDTGRDPVEPIREELERAWGDPAREREVLCPLFMRVGLGRAG